MLSPWLAKTMIGARIALRSIGRPGSMRASFLTSRLPTNSCSTIQRISGSVIRKIAAPPVLELEELLVALVDVAEEIGVLAEQRPAGVQELEVHHQMGAVEDAAAQVRQQHRQPGATQHAGIVAHRVLADLARPGRHRRAVDHDRPGQVGVGRRQQQRRPAALAVAGDHRLGRMPGAAASPRARRPASARVT